MTAALTLSLTLKPVTEWLLIIAGILLVLGPLLAWFTGSVLQWELGALAPWWACWMACALLLVLAAGSLL